MAPEYIAEGRLTDKIDVYSFGVLVLEIVSGLQNNKFQSENSLETLVIHVSANNLFDIHSESARGCYLTFT